MGTKLYDPCTMHVLLSNNKSLQQPRDQVNQFETVHLIINRTTVADGVLDLKGYLVNLRSSHGSTNIIGKKYILRYNVLIETFFGMKTVSGHAKAVCASNVATNVKPLLYRGIIIPDIYYYIICNFKRLHQNCLCK